MSSTKRKIWFGVALAAVVAIGYVMVQGLGNATLYFRTADEAIAQRDEIGSDRFRIEGLVVDGSVGEQGAFTTFKIQSKDTVVDVRNQGQPVGIFREGIPVVLEGSFREGSDVFESDLLMVRHSEEYEADYPDRVSGEANE
jgi:cytochrome c-type biogenesis protein CcmE